MGGTMDGREEFPASTFKLVIVQKTKQLLYGCRYSRKRDWTERPRPTSEREFLIKDMGEWEYGIWHQKL
jgi:hypothetical protein